MLFKFKKILIASRNPAKLNDYRKVFNGLALKIVSLRDLNINQGLTEDGNSLKENAIKKVEFYGKITNLPTVGDDSGLEIDYLNGEPGVKSRRWPGYEATDQELIELVLEKLRGVPWEKRKAQLRAVVAIFLPQKGTFTFETKTSGFILEKPVGELIPGYPFRSIFYVSKYKKPFALLSPEEEDKISHRKRALRKLMKFLESFEKKDEKITK